MKIFKEHYISQYEKLKSVVCYDSNLDPIIVGVESWD